MQIMIVLSGISISVPVIRAKVFCPHSLYLVGFEELRESIVREA